MDNGDVWHSTYKGSGDKERNNRHSHERCIDLSRPGLKDLVLEAEAANCTSLPVSSVRHLSQARPTDEGHAQYKQQVAQ